jgi:glycosyltransferase involved in cell wall biosynthesis
MVDIGLTIWRPGAGPLRTNEVCYQRRVSQRFSQNRPLRVMFWGTYDLSKPRNRILLQGLRASGATVQECRAAVWDHVRDKGTLGAGSLARGLLRTWLAYPQLILRFLRAEVPDVLVVGYLGQLDVLVLCPFARLRGVPVLWDQFLSIYDTVVDDRHKVPRHHPLAKVLYAWEWLACRAADRVLMDTRAHARYVVDTFGVAPEHVEAVWVGAETAVFRPAVSRPNGVRDGLRVLFYGQLIPLHGVETIVRAARLVRDLPITFVLIGSGQEEGLVRRLLEEEPLPSLEWHPWVDYERLIEAIEDADVCLGVFGRSQKAARVIPNKVFQIIAARRPLITQDSPAIRELFDGASPGVRLVPPGNPQALAGALTAMLAEEQRPHTPPSLTLRDRISPEAIGHQLTDVLQRLLSDTPARGRLGESGAERHQP